jgi:hypothetical protein
MLGGPQSRSGHCVEEESRLPLLGNSKNRLRLLKMVDCILRRFTAFGLVNSNASRKSSPLQHEAHKVMYLELMGQSHFSIF